MSRYEFLPGDSTHISLHRLTLSLSFEQLLENQNVSSD